GRDRVLLWQNKRENWIEYRVQITDPGLYQLALTYHPAAALDEGKYEIRSSVEIDVQLNGEFPFREAKAIPFPRWFADDFPIKQNEYGDDIRPSSIQLDEWITEVFRDAAGAHHAPLQW